MDGKGAAWGSFLVGLLAAAALPAAVYATRFSEAYELLDAAFAIPLAAVLGVAALALGRRARRLSAVRLSDESRVGRVGRLLGALGLLIAASALVSLAVYGVLEYVGSRD